MPTGANLPRPEREPAGRREQVALSGRSVALDPRHHAVRSDLADVRLAHRVFAPHYAAPVPRVVTATTELRAERERDSAVLATLDSGLSFELLDVTGDDAWGVATDVRLVGYLDVGLLGEPGR